MYYFLTLFIFALPLSAQTAQIDLLKLELLAAQKALNIELSKQSVADITLDSTLTAKGYSVQVDTVYAESEADYVQLVMPDSLAREALLTLREAGERGIAFIKTSDPNVIRIHKNRLKRAAEALEAAFPAPTR